MIGETLKKHREESGLGLSDIALKLRIRIEHLQAIEDNAFEKLPADVFTIGYIREYAKLFNIDADALVETFKELKKAKTQPVEIPDETINRTSLGPLTENKTHISPGIKIFTAIGAGAIAAIILFTIMEGLQNTNSGNTDNRIIVRLAKEIPVEVPVVPAQKLPGQTEVRAPEPQKAVPSSVTVPSVKASTDKASTEVARKLPEQIKPKPPASQNDGPPLATERRHKLKVIANEDTWLRIETGNEEWQEVMMAQGDSNEWSSRKGFNLKIGNAGGVKLVFNGKDLGTLGEKGKVLQLRLPKEGPKPQQP